MCGLVGMMGDFTFKHKDMMADLLYLDTLRGMDSTGVATFRANGTLDYYKTTLPGYEYIQMNKYKDLLRLTDRVWLGHNRFKTVGMANRTNAHPFIVEDEEGEGWFLFGAHNGTLRNKNDIDKDNAFGTDSEALLNLIGTEGVKDAIGKVEGAWALTWFDGVEEQLNILRNAERPITFAFSEDRKVLFWASESWMLRAAAVRRDIKFLDGSVWQPPEDTLYSFDLPKLGKSIDEPKTIGGIKGKAPITRFQGTGYWTGEKSQRRWVEGTPSQSKSTSKTEEKKSSGVESSDFVVGFEGELISRQLEKAFREAGCDWCGDPIPSDEPISWLRSTDILCNKCKNDTHYSSDKTTLSLSQRERLELIREGRKQLGKA